LTVDTNVNLDSVKNPDNWVTCFTGKIDLPTGYYLGMSAETGGLTDNHDVF